MNPPNGRYMYISHVAVGATAVAIPLGTTHIVFASAATADVYGLLGVNLDGSTLSKMQVPLGEFIRIGSIVPGTTTLITNGTAPATTVTSATFYRWELEK
jgi:hypothetical protein